MAEGSTFAEFIQRIRAGDEQAAVELVRQYEAAVRLEIRFRLRDPRLQRVVDSMDICQSVLKSFFVRTAAGQYDLDQPEQLLKLLVAMARNKVAFHVRRQRTQSRDQRRQEICDFGELIGHNPSPSRVAAGKELLEKLRDSLSPEERLLADRRAQGMGWADIAAELGGTAQGRRKQLTRALDRVLHQLGLDTVSHE